MSTPQSPIERVFEYHDGTKHHFHRFARSLGFLDWASQPRPFRSFEGAPVFELSEGAQIRWPRVAYDQLFADRGTATVRVTTAAIGDFLRHALGLSAWKAFRGSRWSLRVNPSSGNLHPTEAYIVTGAVAGFAETPTVWHYAADRHAVELRCRFPSDAWEAIGVGEPTDAFFVALTSIHWRESWKYGERAFRYCQHDLGHAVAALGLSAALHGWRVVMLPAWPQRAIAALVGLDRDEDYIEAEREESGCLLLVTTRSEPRGLPQPDAAFIEAVQRGCWFGRASQLSEDHVAWTFIDQVARATEDLGRPVENGVGSRLRHAAPFENDSRARFRDRDLDARRIIVQRRSAVAFDGVSSVDRSAFLGMLSRVMPGAGAPWDALWWLPRIHLALFVHRVDGVEPGLYLLARNGPAMPHLKAAFNRDFLWQRVVDDLPLWLLERGDYRLRSKRVSCDQDIAADGFFSLAMIAEFETSLHEQGPSFYRHLFWESGVVGQVAYLEAEAAGARATGIGCFYDDPVHDLLGLDGHAFQSLYHFAVGTPVEDARLTIESGYPGEAR